MFSMRRILAPVVLVSEVASFPPPAGTFEVTSDSYNLPNGFLCGNTSACNIWYPTQLDKGPFPIASFGHGTGGKMFWDLINSVASLGFVVVAPATGNCNDHSADILGAMEWSRTNKSHEALNHVDWSRQGVFGHSFGGAHGMAAVAYAIAHPDEYSMKAGVFSHGSSGNAAPNITIPVMFTSGGEDHRGSHHQDFEACPSTQKVFAEAEGARHMEPMHAGRLNPFDAHFLGCHVADLQTSCDMIYGDGPTTICQANAMKSCEICKPDTGCLPTPARVTTPAPPPHPSPGGTCTVQEETDCGGDFYGEQQVDSSDDCCDLCNADADCMAWTHSKYNDKGKQSPTCYLKKECGSATSNPDCTSGTVNRCTIQEGTDCGGDFYSEHQADTFDACCDLCRADADCMAWTHSKWNDRGQQSPTCYLKKACGSATSTPDCTSGTMDRPSKSGFVIA